MDADLEKAVEALAARDRVLVALDFDGTLAPIVDDPDAAAPLPPAREAVASLVGLPSTHVAVVSGRPLGELRRLLGAPPEVTLIGSHGAETDGEVGLDDAERRLLVALHDAVAGIVEARPGTTVEDKPAAVVLHTRTADRAAALAATGDVLLGPAGWPGVHVLRGKEVVELGVTDATKGSALQRLRAGLRLDAGGVLFAGDDTTDERAFAVLDDDAGDVTVKVGSGETAARHRVADPSEVADLLAFLDDRRRRSL